MIDDIHREQTEMAARRQIKLELYERAALLKWNFTPEVREQLEACASNKEVATIKLTPTDERQTEVWRRLYS